MPANPRHIRDSFNIFGFEPIGDERERSFAAWGPEDWRQTMRAVPVIGKTARKLKLWFLYGKALLDSLKPFLCAPHIPVLDCNGQAVAAPSDISTPKCVYDGIEIPIPGLLLL